MTKQLGLLLPAMALALAAVLFEIALYINLAEHPTRLALTDLPLLEQWNVSFGVGSVLQGSLTIAAGLACLGTWWSNRDWPYGAGGTPMLASWPWTLHVIAPINHALLAISVAAAGTASRALIEQWVLSKPDAPPPPALRSDYFYGLLRALARCTKLDLCATCLPVRRRLNLLLTPPARRLGLVSPNVGADRRTR